ncbi:hypothetical protein NEOLEDRAFT_1142960 [Neolentinus lepideus HHB14362 ss-1]|uniref:Uncharacterized protein n=1 Tax=Neolentinus lepideus HHB14362 ss-1 TaxID=1314782 RepID=A0A165MU77_9AGAM|nr:hypothetical protein NEOLEDRAFT_1142960 [Neolentinus lepideus HHB14362 ss-1]
MGPTAPSSICIASEDRYPGCHCPRQLRRERAPDVRCDFLFKQSAVSVVVYISWFYIGRDEFLLTARVAARMELTERNKDDEDRISLVMRSLLLTLQVKTLNTSSRHTRIDILGFSKCTGYVHCEKLSFSGL